MSDHHPYDLAYICGGPRRVVMVALVALADDDQIKISRARHRVTVTRRAPRDQVEAAVFDAVPNAGRTLGALTAAAADSDAVAGIRAVLRDRWVLARAPWQVHRILRTRSMRRRLHADPPDGLGRVAVLGAPGIADARLREILQAPDPDLDIPDLALPGLPDYNDGPYDAEADVKTAVRLDLYGPGGPGAGL
jgi:hypothetical protein